MRFPWVTQNASERYRERFAPQLTVRQAHARLIGLAASARPTRERSPGGQEIWTTTLEPDVRFVVTQDGGRRIVVTVLLPRELEPPEIDGVDPEEMRMAMAGWGGRRRR